MAILQILIIGAIKAGNSTQLTTFCQSMDIAISLKNWYIFTIGYESFSFLDEKTVEIVKGGCYVVYV